MFFPGKSIFFSQIDADLKDTPIFADYVHINLRAFKSATSAGNAFFLADRRGLKDMLIFTDYVHVNLRAFKSATSAGNAFFSEIK
jgi:hypothetical protein